MFEIEKYYVYKNEERVDSDGFYDEVDEILFMENRDGTWIPIKTVWTRKIGFRKE